MDEMQEVCNFSNSFMQNYFSIHNRYQVITVVHYSKRYKNCLLVSATSKFIFEQQFFQCLKVHQDRCVAQKKTNLKQTASQTKQTSVRKVVYFRLRSVVAKIRGPSCTVGRVGRGRERVIDGGM